MRCRASHQIRPSALRSKRRWNVAASESEPCHTADDPFAVIRGVEAAKDMPSGAWMDTDVDVGLINGCMGSDREYVPWAPSPFHPYPRSRLNRTVRDRCGRIRMSPLNACASSRV